jgi:hypothetical protein
MTSFYKFQRMAYSDLDKRIKWIISNKETLNLSLTILEITGKYEVSEKAILKRIEHWVLSNDKLVLKDNELRFVE